MNLYEANAAVNEFYNWLAYTSDPSQITSHYPTEAINCLTAIGGSILVAYCAVIALVLYLLVGRMKCVYRFVISAVVFAVAACLVLMAVGMNLFDLGNALVCGTKLGIVAALIGLAFATFYRKDKKD